MRPRSRHGSEPTSRTRRRGAALASGRHAPLPGPSTSPTHQTSTSSLTRPMPQPITYDQASKNLNSAMTRYRARYLSGYDLPDVVRRATEAQSPETKLTRAGLEAKYTAPVYSDPKSDTYVAP